MTLLALFGGLALLLYGMQLTGEGVQRAAGRPPRPPPPAGHDLSRQALVAFAANPVLGILAGAFLSATMASSAATIGLALSLASQGLLGLAGAVPILLGANIR